MITREECLAYAADCAQMARHERDPAIRASLEELAKTWRELAEQLRNLPATDR